MPRFEMRTASFISRCANRYDAQPLTQRHFAAISDKNLGKI